MVRLDQPQPCRLKSSIDSEVEAHGMPGDADQGRLQGRSDETHTGQTPFDAAEDHQGAGCQNDREFKGNPARSTSICRESQR